MIVKICGLRTAADAQWAQECGADLLGFVFEPSSPRYVGAPDWSPEWIASLATPKVAVFGPMLHDVAEGFDFIQAHTWPEAWTASRPVVPVVRVGVELQLQQLPEANVVLLDAYDPHHHGGSGLRIEADAARTAIEAMRNARPGTKVILAGGLTPENVAEAIRTLRPDGVDVSSGVESSPGVKDHGKIKAFLEAARSAS